MSDLCCCEYIDEKGAINHILACCCDCQNFDESFECVITGKAVPQHNKTGAVSTMTDRMRLPWLGGAKRIPPDVALSVFAQLSIFSFATINFKCTIISTLLLIILFLTLYKASAKYPFFFFTWTCTSVIVLYIVFEFIVVSFLKILLEENIVLSLLILGFIISAYYTKKRLNYRKGVVNHGNTLQHCNLCKIDYNQHFGQHRLWLNVCIISENQRIYIITLIFAILSLLYSSNLTLTTICHPFTFVLSILLPDDCTDAYQIMDLSIPFVAALYSIFIVIILIFDLFSQILITVFNRNRKKYNFIFTLKYLSCCFK